MSRDKSLTHGSFDPRGSTASAGSFEKGGTGPDYFLFCTRITIARTNTIAVRASIMYS